ncbi:MAG: sigma-70 family RNA polymerase sigma factor [Eubacteriales bacterium]|nr:sigma-70 family RNA polymerase sigma factor [Eubacteriales bacterium]
MQNVETLFCEYRDDVYRLALSYTRNVQEAEDVCQTVFLKLMEQQHIAPGKERAWLMQVTANECRNLLRSSWWRKTTELDASIAVPPPQYSGVFQAVMGLKPKYRVVVYLHYYECCTTGEIAQMLKVSRSVVTTRLNRARQTLKEQLKEVTV